MSESMKRFTEFEAMVPDNFAELMVDYWEADEKLSRDEVIASYYDESFKELDKHIAGTKRRFVPDLGYADTAKDGTLCFEAEDNNFAIPVEILEVIE